MQSISFGLLLFFITVIICLSIFVIGSSPLDTIILHFRKNAMGNISVYDTDIPSLRIGEFPCGTREFPTERRL